VRRLFTVAATIAAHLATTAAAFAHGFGPRYDLPIPLSHYIFGAGATVAVSFAIFAAFMQVEPATRRLPVLVLHLHGVPAALCGAGAAVARGLSVAIFLLVILVGFFGNQSPVRNLAPTMVWIIGWVGIAFLSPVLGNVWRTLNPWDALYRGAEALHRRAGRGALSCCWRYPAWLQAWPAFALFVGFAWMELVWSGRSVPAELAAALTAYSAVTWAAMFAFGRCKWLARGEVFTLVFGIFARLPRWHGQARRAARSRFGCRPAASSRSGRCRYRWWR